MLNLMREFPIIQILVFQKQKTFKKQPRRPHTQTHLCRLFQRLGLGLGLRRVLLHLLALGAIRLLLQWQQVNLNAYAVNNQVQHLSAD